MMDPKGNETPLLTKIIRRFRAQCNKTKRCTKYTEVDCSSKDQNDTDQVPRDAKGNDHFGCHCVSSCHKSPGGQISPDFVFQPVSDSGREVFFPTTLCQNSGMPDDYSGLCKLLDQLHRLSHPKPCKRDSQIQTDPLPNLPPLGFQEHILSENTNTNNNNTSPARIQTLYYTHAAKLHYPTQPENSKRESFDQANSSECSASSVERRTSASRTLSEPSLQKSTPTSPGMGNFQFDHVDFRLRTSSCMLASPTSSDLSHPGEYQRNFVTPDREQWDQESTSTPLAYGYRSLRTQSQSTPTHENNLDDFVLEHRRRSLSDSYAFEGLRATRSEKKNKMKRNGSARVNGVIPHHECKRKYMLALEDKHSKKTAFSSFLDKMPKLSLLRRFKEKPMQYDSVPDLSKFDTPRARLMKGTVNRNVRSHEQLDKAGLRQRRAFLSKTQGTSSQHSDCGYIDPDIVSRNFSKNNALFLSKPVRKTMSCNSFDNTVPSGSKNAKLYRRSLHLPAPRSCDLADVNVRPDNNEFYMTFDPDWNPPCQPSTSQMPLHSPATPLESHGVAQRNWRQAIADGQESFYEKLGDVTEDNGYQVPIPRSRLSISPSRHLLKQSSLTNQDNRKYMPLPPLPSEHTKQDIYQEIPADSVFLPIRTSPPPGSPAFGVNAIHRDNYEYQPCDDMHHGTVPQSRSRFVPFSPSSLPGNHMPSSRSSGHGNVFFPEEHLVKKLPVVSENGTQRRLDIIPLHRTEVSKDATVTMDMPLHSPPVNVAHHKLRHTLSCESGSGHHPTLSTEPKGCPGRDKNSAGKVKIPPIFLQQ
ncbi:uncharacterized protein LOC121428353 [Lytechinus variegatus]|uniref:uncharacterized protein LOC121428353 n=1 Tax=Lytechinus variegatus TaxID=7654 RepID=UPI001BB10ACC|nr:uncharacterized protein LOC121428353 [Lytechinus variegatus]